MKENYISVSINVGENGVRSLRYVMLSYSWQNKMILFKTGGPPPSVLLAYLAYFRNYITRFVVALFQY